MNHKIVFRNDTEIHHHFHTIRLQKTQILELTMLTKYLPIYGKIKSIASAGDSKMVSLSHDKDSGVYSLHSLDVQEIIHASTQFQREENCVSIPLDSLAKNEDPLYVLASEDNNFLVTENGIYTVECQAKYQGDHFCWKGAILWCRQQRKSQDLALISNDELCIYSKKRTKYSKEQGISGSATALSISTDGKWIAVGYENGTVEVLGKVKFSPVLQIQWEAIPYKCIKMVR